jgi:GGDEF domain-containing protein
VIYISIGDIDSFGEAYGFVAGDDVLRAIGLIVSNVVDESGDLSDFVGQVDKADFLLVVRENKAQEIRNKLATRLSRAFDYFYPIRDIESGHVTAPMRAEVGIATASGGPYEKPADIYNAARRSRQVIAATQSARA